MADEEPDIHSLLRRQLRRAGIDDPSAGPSGDDEWEALLGRVSRTYESADRDRYLLERSLDVSSAEMQELHTQLAEDKDILNSVLGALSSGICHLDPDWKIRFVNAAARRQLHLFGDEEYRAFDSFSFNTAQGEPIDATRIERLLESGQPMAEDDVVVVRTDGSTFPASVTFNPMRRGDELAGIVVSIVDITERKRAQREIEEAHVEAAAAERARQAQAAFLANMSHELRTPLNAILGYSELVLEDVADLGYDEVAPDLRKINSAGRHLLSLINDVLDMSRIQAGRLDLDLQEVDVCSVLEEVADTIRPITQKNDNELRLEFGEDACFVETDRLRLKQALINVAGNAGKFTSDGRVTLRASRIDAETVEIEIEDTGIGMSEDVVEMIFEPFTQADSSTTRRFGGTGLGLAITRSICSPLGIELSVDTSPGEGSTFRFGVPLEFHSGEYRASPASGSGSGLEPERGPQTVLLIDDDPSSHHQVARYLEDNEISVVPATTGAEGIRLAREMHPNAIILDIVLPDVDGWDVLSMLKSEPDTSDTPLLVVSSVADASRAFKLGAQDYLVKPVERARLLSILTRYRARTGRSKVLVVEDDDDLRALMCRKIEKETTAWDVLEASSGIEAHATLERGTIPDVILLDLMMPGMDGFEFLARLRGHPTWDEIPVVVVTAMDLTSDQRRTLNQRVEGIVEKGEHSPIEIAETVIEMLAFSTPRKRKE